MRRVVVVGAGISGLAAAWELTQAVGPRGAPEPLEVVVLEASPVAGGKLRTGEVAGHRLDVGAESMLARRPEALALLDETGLVGPVVHPVGASATIWSRGHHHPLPPRTLMGVPSDPETARGLLTPGEVERLRHEPRLAPLEHDVSVGDFVQQRVGAAVVDRLVEPLLAGVYAGHARQLSLQASVPALWSAGRRGESLVAAAAAAARAGADDAAGPRPVFAGYRGGLGVMVADLVRRLETAGVVVRTGVTVRGLERVPDGWLVTSGPTTGVEQLHADAVVLAVPAAPASRLLSAIVPSAAAVLRQVEYASMAVVTLAVPRRGLTDLLGPVGLSGSSGFLVPPAEPVTVKAATFSFAKWSWVDALDEGVVLLRSSVGRAGEEATLHRDDAEIVRTVVDDLGVVLGGPLPPLVDHHVQRWGGGLPQYAVGHVGRVASVRDAVARTPGLAVAGAAYDGVGVPACVGSGRAAARQVVTHLSRPGSQARE
ncbi:MAG: protoporphyrinogen oxidase [Actinomycetota bacterium]|nr:protoporphyrinogen oxidase [Actinomycetota bacterium]